MTAERIRTWLAKECKKRCPDVKECEPACRFETFADRDAPVAIEEVPACNDAKCRVAGTLTSPGSGLITTFIEICSYDGLPRACECEDVECMCHSDCADCTYCSDQGKCVPDASAPPECCPPWKKTLTVEFEITTTYGDQFSCDGILIAPGYEEVRYALFESEVGVDGYDLKSDDVVIFETQCQGEEACSNLPRKSMGLIKYSYYEDEESQGEVRNWYVGQYYEGVCRSTYNQVVSTRVRALEPIIGCTE